jgi:hypothetical protein
MAGRAMRICRRCSRRTLCLSRRCRNTSVLDT